MQEIVKIKRCYGYNGNYSIKIYILILIVIFTLVWKNIDSSKSLSINYIFYQPLLKDKMDWNSVFKKLNQAEIETIILQWSKFGVVDFLKDEKWLKDIISNADRYNIKVIVGLYGDDRYFKNLEKRDIDIEKYLTNLLTQNILQAKKIYKIAKEHNSFKGYYIYDEVDDTNFQKDSREIYLKKYLQKMAKEIGKISKDKLYISSYFSKNMSIDKYMNFISNITDHRYTLLLQSGIGANLVNNKDSARYIKSFSKKFKGDFIPIVESFKMENSKIRPIDIESLKNQIKIIKESTNSSTIALFSLRYFLDNELFYNYTKNINRTY